MSVEIVVIGPQRPFVLETLEREFIVQQLWHEADKVGPLRLVTAGSW